MHSEIYCCLVTDFNAGNRIPLIVCNEYVAVQWLNQHHRLQVRHGNDMLDAEIARARKRGIEPDIDWTCGKIEYFPSGLKCFQTQSSKFQVYPVVIHTFIPDNA